MAVAVYIYSRAEVDMGVPPRHAAVCPRRNLVLNKAPDVTAPRPRGLLIHLPPRPDNDESCETQREACTEAARFENLRESVLGLQDVQ